MLGFASTKQQGSNPNNAIRKLTQQAADKGADTLVVTIKERGEHTYVQGEELACGR